MIEQHRTMELPGEGIVRDPGPTKQHEEYPRYMTHPGEKKARVDKETHILGEDGQRTGRVMFSGAEAARFQPVLVRTPASRDEHLSYGYQDHGKMDPAAFARMVADRQPAPETYVPILYPKYVFGKVVANAQEEEDRLIELNINADGSPRVASSEPVAAEPAVSAEVSTLLEKPGVEEDEIATLEAKLAALKAKKAEPAVAIKEAAADEPLVMKEPEAQVAAEPTMEEYAAKRTAQLKLDAVAKAAAAAQAAPAKPSRSEAIKAGIARKRAERAAAQAQKEDKAA